ncbi:MAG: MarR family transcriptional regulator [Actinobacteria bacterium]|nr:MAG: MarR family transcriptional regulator [Actinomycetota bacterium]
MVAMRAPFIVIDMICDCLGTNSCREDILTWNSRCQVPRRIGFAPGACFSRARSPSSTCSIAMNELAERILYSKSGFTRVVDRMEEAGLVRRVRPENDRRTILIVLTDKGTETMERARRQHRDGIHRHFSEHLSDTDVKALTRALEKISTHARPLRPGRIRSSTP